jgi:hypothetical protein
LIAELNSPEPPPVLALAYAELAYELAALAAWKAPFAYEDAEVPLLNAEFACVKAPFA